MGDVVGKRKKGRVHVYPSSIPRCCLCFVCSGEGGVRGRLAVYFYMVCGWCEQAKWGLSGRFDFYFQIVVRDFFWRKVVHGVVVVRMFLKMHI